MRVILITFIIIIIFSIFQNTNTIYFMYILDVSIAIYYKSTTPTKTHCFSKFVCDPHLLPIKPSFIVLKYLFANPELLARLVKPSSQRVEVLGSGLNNRLLSLVQRDYGLRLRTS